MLQVQTQEFEEPISPRTSLEQLQNPHKEKAQLSDWLTIMKKAHSRLDAVASGNHQSRPLLLEFEKVARPISPAKNTIKVDLEDVQDEIKY